MGGFGSGRTGGRPTIENSGSLVLAIEPIMRFVRKGLRAAGLDLVPPGATVAVSPFPWGWMYAGETEPWATIVLHLTLGDSTGTAWLEYDIKHVSRPTGRQRYQIGLVVTPCRFGGRRWWWVCPHSGRKVSKLYLPNGGLMFLSRGIEGYDLAYASQREDENRRTLRRARYLRARFGSEQGLASHPIPPRPRRMRETTYWRYVDDLLKIERRLEAQFDMFSSRYEGRFIRSETVGRS